MNIGFNKAKWVYDSDGCWLNLLVDSPADAKKFCAGMKDKQYTAELKKQTKKRSLDANSYLWALIGKLADVLRTDKNELYYLMLKRYGQGGVAKIPNDMVDIFQRTYKYNEQHEKLPPEEKAQYFRFWLGSSDYNTEEMSILIDGVVSECKEQGIETLTPKELFLIKEEWGK